MIIKDVAQEFQNQLGSKFKLFIDNNAGAFVDISKNMKLIDQLTLVSKYISVIFKTSAGERVALSNLYTTSFDWSLEFFTPVDTNIDNEIETLVQAFNGDLNSVGLYKYFLTFNTPTAQGRTSPQNGQYYQVILLSGSLLVTDQSVLANEIGITLDGKVVDGLLSWSPSVQASSQVDGMEGTKVPLVTHEFFTSSYPMLIHDRRDSVLGDQLMSWIIDINNYDDTTPLPMLISYKEVSTSIDVTLESISLEANIGGFLLINLSLTRTVTLSE